MQRKIIAKRLAAIWRQTRTVYYDINLEAMDVQKLEAILKELERLKDKYKNANPSST